MCESHVNALEHPIAYNRNKVEALLKIIVAIHNSCHHQNDFKFSRAYALVDVTKSSDDVEIHNF